MKSATSRPAPAVRVRTSLVAIVGVFGFFVKKSKNQYLCAYSDANGDKVYQPGEPAWISTGPDGKPSPLDLTSAESRRTEGKLSSKTIIPEELINATHAFVGNRTRDKAKSGWNLPIALGEVANNLGEVLPYYYDQKYYGYEKSRKKRRA